MAASTAASAAVGASGGGGSFFAQQASMVKDMANRKRWNKMSDAEVRALYDKGGRRSQGAFDEIQRRQTLGGFGQEAAGGNNVVDGDGDNRLMDIESRLAALEGGGENVMEGAGVGGSAEISGGFSDGSLDAAENIYGTEEERMAAAGAATAQQTAANAAAISGL